MHNNKIITVQNIPITISETDLDDYICITDIASAKLGNSRAADVVRNRLRNRTTIEFLSTWEEIYNPNFKVFESEHFKKQSGLLTFTPSVSEWVEQTDAIGLFRFTAKAWRESNPELAKHSNVRDYSSINELTVLSNLKTHNAQMIREGKSKEERFSILKGIAEYQLRVLNEAQNINERIEINVE